MSGSGTSANATSIAVGRTNSCAIYDDGTAACWGNNADAISTIPSTINEITDISPGYEDTCVIHGSNHTIHCWGANFDNSMDDFNGSTGYKNIAVSYRHACAQEIGTDSIHCWGTLNKGDVLSAVESYDMGTSADHYMGIFAGSGLAFTKGNEQYGELSIPAGAWMKLTTETAHSCGIRRNGAVQCWGNNTYGETVIPEL